jgi:CheY-like chemotaxis protein
MNLLVNARDAMPEGGTVRISLTQIHLEPDEVPASNIEPGSYARLQISDTGEGMSPEVQARIFEPFFSTKPRGQGTGLGLAIVHGIVQDHGGWITVDSKPSAGTTFSVYFPSAVHSDPVEAHEAEAELTVPPGIGVLVVEDDALVRATLAKTLCDAGYSVLQAANGVEALKVFRNNAATIRVVVADVELPGMSGPECLDRIRAEKPGVQGLIVTGRTDPSAPAEGRRGVDESAASGYPVLLKPFQMKDFRLAVGRLVSPPKAQSPLLS